MRIILLLLFIISQYNLYSQFYEKTSTSETGIIINEFSNGPSGTKEYVELLVIGTPGTTLDLRGWIIDDNNGEFSQGAIAGVGIASGYLKFSNHCNWAHVPVGSIILLYNSVEKNDRILLADDPYDIDLNYVYIVPVNFNTTCNSGGPNVLFDYECTRPITTDSSYPNTTLNAQVNWLTIGLANGGDAIQTRKPDKSYFQGFSYGTGGTAPKILSLANHPDYSTYTVNSLYSNQSGNKVYSFTNTITDDYRNINNWTISTGSLTAADTRQTPGSANNSSNLTFINNLKSIWPINQIAYTDICNIIANETAEFFSGTAPNNQIITRIQNNSVTNHGSTNVTCILNSTGNFLTSISTTNYYFLQKHFHVTPTNSNNSNYNIRVYFTNTELTSYKNYINTLLGTSHTNLTILPLLSIYKSPGNEDVTLPTSLIKGITTYGTYGSGYWFEANFTSFSGFGLGIEETALPINNLILNVKLINNTAQLYWETFSEKNNRGFEIEKSINGLEYSDYEFIAGKNSYSNYYSFYDYNINQKQYYRLRQIDYDNKYIYSNTVELTYTDNEIFIYPNPSNGEININFNKDYESSIELFNEYGQILYSRTEKLSIINLELQSLFTKLSRGIYFCKIKNNDNFKNIKIIKI